MGIQDAHTHFFSRPFFDALARMSPRDEPPTELLAEVSGKTGLEIPDATPEEHAARWVAQMDANGVERMVTFASHPAEAEAVARGAQSSGGRLLPYTVIDPTKDAVADFLEWAADEGFRGFLTFPAMQGFAPDDERLDRFYRVAAEAETPVIVHCGILKIKLRDLLGIPKAYDLERANPLKVIPAAQRHPGCRFILPHFGGGFFREALIAGAQCENILVDTSSSNDWMRTSPAKLTLTEVFARTLDVFGPDRVLFGTDSGVFPRGWRSDLLEAQRGALEAAGASEEDRDKVLGGNLAALLP